MRYFAARGRPVEWKLYGYDQPADLAQRLLAAGIVADDEELMLVAETAAIDSDVKPPKARLEPVTGRAGVEAMMAVHDLAFAGLPPLSSASGGYPVREAPSWFMWSSPWPVTSRSARPGWSSSQGLISPGAVGRRNRSGLARPGNSAPWSAYRAGLAAARGYRDLQVDALPASLLILQRLGFKPVASTTPYCLDAAGQ